MPATAFSTGGRVEHKVMPNSNYKLTSRPMTIWLNFFWSSYVRPQVLEVCLQALSIIQLLPKGTKSASMEF